jgi:hypothetical protein
LVPSRGGLRDVPVDGVDVGSVEFVVLVVMSVSSRGAARYARRY